MSAAVVATSSSPNNNGDDQENNNKSSAHLSEAIANDGSPQERKDDDSKQQIMGSHEHGTSAACRPDISTNRDTNSGDAGHEQNATVVSQNRAVGPSSANAAVPEKRNDLETKPSAAASSTESAAEKEACSLTQAHQQQPASPLPPELLGILKEVAKTGTCSWLPWNLDEDDKRGRTGVGGGSSSSTHAAAVQQQLPSHRQHPPQQQQYHSSGSSGKRHHHYHGGAMGSSSKRARSGIGSSSKHKHQAMQHRHYYGGGSATTTTTTATATGSSNVASGPSVGTSSGGGGGQQPPMGGAQASASTSAAAARKNKYHNGLHPRPSSGRRFADAGGGNSGGGRKHPLFLIRTTSTASNTSSIFSPGSVGSSGRTSGSEPEESSQYECDSEGTSATSNSELSFDARGGASSRKSELRKRRGLALQKGSSGRALVPQSTAAGQAMYKCLKDAFRAGINLVLDHFYENRGGYKLSPAEKRKSTPNSSNTASTKNSAPEKRQSLREKVSETDSDSDAKMSAREAMMKEGSFAINGSGNPTAASEKSEGELSRSQDVIYRERKEGLLDRLGLSSCGTVTTSSKSERPLNSASSVGPPFTIQRIAEVLIAPERYYTQTHKLCNCLDKLLLVTSSARAFGGSSGGDTSQSRLEEMELAALADEKTRLEAEFRESQRRLRQKSGSPMSDAPSTAAAKERDGPGGSPSEKEGCPENTKALASTAEEGESRRRAGSESDSDGEDQNLHRGGESECPDISREMLEAAARASLRTKFDHVGIDPHSTVLNNRDVRSIAESRGMTNSPPPPSLGITAASGIALPGGHSGLLRHHSPSSPTSPDKEHSPLARVSSPILFHNSNNNSNPSEGSSSPTHAPLHSNPTNLHLLQMHHAAAMAGVAPFELFNSTVGGPASGPVAVPGLTVKDMDIESRSSASSDVDSESDVSFDDSASDRSDGSDSGQHYEPLTAAHAMALNRRQQQQRLQSRVLTSLQQHGNDARPPSDAEYQSGDSIDSTRAEDSGGSDSSSSDIAD